MDVVTPTDRPKYVRNRCVIEFLVAFFVFTLFPFDNSIRMTAFVIGLSEISPIFSLISFYFESFVVIFLMAG